ncbi:MAG: DUF2088 domain-containing protein [Planctomycetes bacterium]|nr:DUF2088 domain-containing protein [Planctomycetota bacterium]
MTTIFAQGGPGQIIDQATRRAAVRAAVEYAGDTSRTLALPPDATRPYSGAAELTQMLYQEIGRGGLFHVMPAIGTHHPMTPAEIRRMFGHAIPPHLFFEHRWREDIVRPGSVPSEFVRQVSQGALSDTMPDYDVPIELSRRLLEGDYSAIFSLGQVVPHEVVGMANGFKNVLVGAGGQQTIHKTHFLGAVYGLERMMGRADTPVRAVLNYAHDHFLADLPIIYALTVMAPASSGETIMRGIFVGDDHATFLQAARLSQQVNITLLHEPQPRIVAYLDPEEFKSAWLGNKAVYRTRMAIADGGELIVIAPGIRTFGEDREIDGLIRRHGYRGTQATFAALQNDGRLMDNLSAAAHLIHGSSEGRFRIVYATDPSLISPEQVQGVGFEWRDVSEMIKRYAPRQRRSGPQDGFYFVRRPALGLWALEKDFPGASTK